MKIAIYVSALILMTWSATHGYNILAVFPSPFVSHQRSCQGITMALAKRGHNVTVITSKPNRIPIQNHNEIDVSFLSQVFQEFQNKRGILLQTRLSLMEIASVVPQSTYHMMNALLHSKQVQTLLRSNSTFDLILYEGLYPSALGFVHRYNYTTSATVVSIPVFNKVQYSMGNPIETSYMSNLFLSASDQLTFVQRLINTLYLMVELYLHTSVLYPEHDKVVKKHFGEDTPSVQELETKNSLLLLSGDLSQNYPMPLQPNTIQVGTLHVYSPHEPLQYDLEQWMDEATDGVIYFSLGSIMNSTSLSQDRREAFAKAFSRFPTHRVVWKWESDLEFPGKPQNVLLRDWLPQQEHPKTKLFVSHCGHQSRQESIHYGIPILGLPLFWDQGWNCEKLVINQAALVINFDHITEDIVYEKIHTILYDSRYKENMEKLSMISKDKPMTGPDTAVWWIEYVIRHKGAPHLRPAVQDLHWFQYLLTDILAFIITVLIVIIYVLYFLILKISRKLSIRLRKYKQS